MGSANHHPKRVLIIEDSAGFRLIYRELLGNRGHQVIEAEDGQRGIDLAREERPDLILLDLLLPKVHGFEVLRKIRANPDTKDIPVIIFTVVDEKADTEEAYRLGANEFILKSPSIPEEFSRKVFTYLDELPVSN